MRLVTLNTYGFAQGPFGLWKRAPNRTERLVRIGQWLKQGRFDLAFLQEVYGFGDGEIVRRESGLTHAYFPGYGSGLGILSRFPLERPAFHGFRWQGSHRLEGVRLAARMKNGLATAWIEANGRRQLVGVTHLLARYHGVEGFAEPADGLTPERIANLIEVMAALKGGAGSEPWILAGDLNMNYESAEYAFLGRFSGWKDGLFECRGGAVAGEATYAADNPWVAAQGNPGEGVLDYVLYSDGAYRPRSAAIRRETDGLSDHRAVEVELEASGRAVPIRPPDFPPGGRRVLTDYFRRVRVSWWFYAAPLAGWTQRRNILRFLESVPSS